MGSSQGNFFSPLQSKDQGIEGKRISRVTDQHLLIAQQPTEAANDSI